MVELLNVFPKLAQGGGFEFLGSGNRLRDTCTRNTCTQQPLARLPNLFSVMLRLHTAINRADFVSW